jgi:hypothetical protein
MQARAATLDRGDVVVDIRLSDLALFVHTATIGERLQYPTTKE